MERGGSMEDRAVLYFIEAEDGRQPLTELTAHGWRVFPATTKSEAIALIDKHHIRVGIVPLPGAVTVSDNDIWAVRNEVKWIALLPPGAVRECILAQEIYCHFYDFHTLPVDFNRLALSLGHAQGMAFVAELAHPDHGVDREHEMVGTSDVMRDLFKAIRKVASVNAPVLITGESGTGKELAARAIHERSSRSEGPFVAVNCGALPPNLIQSELFGHEKGSFTGAQGKIGFIEAAAGGTLFLDEIGDLPLDLQINLLRFLQESTIERVGGRRPISVDVRIIAATNVDLVRAVREGRFRDDLFYRLHVLGLTVPPLRDRGDDVELLARFFCQKFAAETRRSVKGFSKQGLQAIRDHNWPGNVRELINSVRRAVVMTENLLITPADLGLSSATTCRCAGFTLEQARNEAEAEVIRDCLVRSGNNVSRAARTLDVSRVTLYRLMEKHSISMR